MTKHREDVAPWARANDEVCQLLRDIGGRNPFDENTFRLVRGSGVRKLRGGNWPTYRNGVTGRDIGSYLIDEEGRKIPKIPEKPIKITTEYRMVRTYPDSINLNGWVIEEWHPAHMFGSPQEWERTKVEGHPGMPMLGPYPNEGRYMLATPKSAPEVPGATILQSSINYVMRCREFWGNLTPANRRRLEEDSDLLKQALIEKYEEDLRHDMIKDAMSPILSNSLEAGRWREEIAKAVRETGFELGHVGN